MQFKPSSGDPGHVGSGEITEPAVSRVTSPRFLSVEAVAAVLGTSDVTLYRAIHGGEFPAIKIRGRYVIPAKILDEMEDAAINSGALVNASEWADGRGAA